MFRSIIGPAAIFAAGVAASASAETLKAVPGQPLQALLDRAQDGDVVDAMGHVHGVDRLSVIDASVIPEPPSGFPHLITLMLAEHLSEKLSDLL